jgi:hypothetical protein
VIRYARAARPAKTVTTRQQRIDEFRQDAPPIGQPLNLLCEDHNGTYALPYPCQWIDGAWRNGNTGAEIDASVLGWRSRES